MNISLNGMGQLLGAIHQETYLLLKVEYFCDVHLTSIAIECWVFDPNVNYFPRFYNSLHAVLVCYSEVRKVLLCSLILKFFSGQDHL